jgi:hypothetical protein
LQYQDVTFCKFEHSSLTHAPELEDDALYPAKHLHWKEPKLQAPNCFSFTFTGRQEGKQARRQA